MDKEKKLNEFIEILEELKDELKKEYKASVIGIFGSYVRNLQKKKAI